jgi:selenocysteine lyase/cysteine desulfurase
MAEAMQVLTDEEPTASSVETTQDGRAFVELEKAVHAALETYSNVHRGTGHASMVSTALFERARHAVLDYLGLDHGRCTVVFATPRGTQLLAARLEAGRYQVLSSRDVGLPLGVRALAVDKSALPGGIPPQTGGGAIRHVSRDVVVWAGVPERYEAGTPSIVNVITFARALELQRRYGDATFSQDAGSSVQADRVLLGNGLGRLAGRPLLTALREACMGRGLPVPTADGPAPHIYLDNAASTPALAPIWEVVRRVWRIPASSYPAVVRVVRAICASFLRAPLTKYDVLFTSNTTEAINLLAWNLTLPPARHPSSIVLNTLMEHHSNELPWRYLRGVSLVRAQVDDEGFVDMADLEGRLQAHNGPSADGGKRVVLVAVCGASNVLGTCNDLAAISRVAHTYGAHVLVDGAQLVAHRPIDLDAWGVDCLAFSAHKMYAPFGAGALVVRRGLLRERDGELDRIRSQGEENVAGIAAMGQAMQLLQRVGMQTIEQEERELTARMLKGLAKIPDVQVFGVSDPGAKRFARRGGVVSFSVRRVPHNLVARLLAEWGGISVRNGCFCAHILVSGLLRIHWLREAAANIGLTLFPDWTERVLPGLVRVSLGLENDEQDIDRLLKVVRDIAAAPMSRANRTIASTYNGTPALPATETTARMQAFVEEAVGRVYGEWRAT